MEDALDDDADGDGIPDEIEQQLGLDPLDASDASGDLDGDGVSNLDEYTDGSDPLVDDYAPVFGTLDDLVINATALLTALPDLEAPVAVDGLDGNVEASPATSNSWFAPGLHELTWTASDAAGNLAEAIQRLLVRPLISMTPDQQRGEGSSARVRIVLNGESPVYPFDVGYLLEGTADSDDHDLLAGSVTFTSGQLEQEIVVNIADDGIAEGRETLRIRLDEAGTTPDFANFGARQSNQIHIVEENIAPNLQFSLQQNGQEVRLVVQDGSPVTVTAIVDDPNPGDTHSYGWSLPATEAIDDGAAGRIFDPSTLAPGVYRIELTVSEEHASGLSTSASLLFQLVATAPALQAGSDSDGDGIDDLSEGIGDLDGDGIPDYLDPVSASNVLNEQLRDGRRFLMETEPGLTLSLGEWAMAQRESGAQINEEGIGGEGGIHADEYQNVGGYFDLVVSNIPEAGASVKVVIPQRQAIPQEPIYRKYNAGEWYTFVEDASNGIASAPGTEGFCPPPGDAAFTPGLTPGHWCVQLILEDGGPNDDDHQVNGAITDPGGVATVKSTAVFQTRSGGGGALAVPAAIMLLLLGLWRAAQADRRARPGNMMLPLVLAVAIAFPLTGNAQSVDEILHNVYVTGSGGYAVSPVTKGDLRQDFARRGVDAEVINVDSSRSAWRLGLGYTIDPRWSVEAAYQDLGDVDLEFAAPTGSVNPAEVHPHSGRRLHLSAVYRHAFTPQLSAQARLGLFSWRQTFRSDSSGTKIDSATDSGTELTWGFGLSHQLDSGLGLSGNVERIEFDRDPSYLFSIGFQFRLQ